MAKELSGSLSRDRNSEPVQVLELDTVANVTIASSSNTSSLPSGTVAGDILRIACDVDCYFTFGGTADSNDHLFIQGVEYVRVPKGATAIAAIWVDTTGVLTATRLL